MVVCSCAQQGAPTGGPKDENPPVLLKAVPENYSTNFTAKKIMLTFDEYLDMGNFTQELVVSPPMDEKPEIKLRNKTLIIEFEEELKEDITYTFNFGEGIKDLNERNVLLNFEYVVSTGDYLDSLSVKGRLKNAFDLTIPETPISIMLYTELQDSLPLKEIPYYVGRADTEGNFAVNNLKPNIYKLFVLKDGNNNFLFDLPEEEIAFLDSSLLVDAAYFKTILLESGKYDSLDFVQDTIPLAIDTTGLSADTIAMMLDSLEQLKPDINSVYVDLFMFKEESENQYISDYSRDERKKIELLFNIPLTDSFEYVPVFPTHLTNENFVEDFGKKRDSLTLWLSDTIIASIDTIKLKVSYTGRDSINLPLVIHDTLSFTYKEPTKKGNSRNNNDEEKEKVEVLKVNTIRNNGKQDLNKRLAFSLDVPLGEIDTSKFRFYIIPDTVEVPMNVYPAADTSNLYNAYIDLDWPEETSYRMTLYPGAIKDIYGTSHDTIDVKFNTKTISNYGIIQLNLSKVEDSVLIQIFNNKILVRKKSISGPGIYMFEYLNPAKYRIKFVHDKNLNREWNTGDYMKGVQPEKVEFLPTDINVRANWDHEIDYEMGSNDTFPAEEKKETEGQTQPDTNGRQPSNFDTGPGNIPPANNRQNNTKPQKLEQPNIRK
ncbi:Ig-like domain-containing protein [Bacteroidota bacterium]